MSRRNWNVIFAAIGITLAALLGFQSYQFYEAAEQQRARYEYQPARSPGFRIDSVTKRPAPYYKPSCNNPDNREDADLCAQWAAVDQVTESNRFASLNLRLTILTFLATVFGTSLLVWTLYETRLTARRELRAYVSARIAGIEIDLEDGTAIAHIKIKNGGQTPAYDLRHAGGVAIRTAEEAERDIIRKEQKFVGLPKPFTLQIGEEESGTIPAHEPITEDGIRQVIAGGKWVYVWGMVFYRDTFGIERQTRFCVRTNSFTLPTKEEMAMYGGGLAHMGLWQTVHFHNAST